MKNHVICTLWLTFMLVISLSARATIVYMDDLPAMVHKSDVIIHAAVADQSVKLDKNGRILTLTTLEVLDGLKGAKTGELILLYQVGGEIDGRVERVVGAQRYQFGEELVLFGVRLRDMIVSYGVGVGKFKVLRSSDGVKVVEDIHDLVAVKKGSSGIIDTYEPTPREFPSLNLFKTQIREQLATRAMIRMTPLKKKL